MPCLLTSLKTRKIDWLIPFLNQCIANKWCNKQCSPTHGSHVWHSYQKRWINVWNFLSNTGYRPHTISNAGPALQFVVSDTSSEHLQGRSLYNKKCKNAKTGIVCFSKRNKTIMTGLTQHLSIVSFNKRNKTGITGLTAASLNCPYQVKNKTGTTGQLQYSCIAQFPSRKTGAIATT